MGSTNRSKGIGMKNELRFPYKSTSDSKYIKDRNILFRENGNGWWFETPEKGGRRKTK